MPKKLLALIIVFLIVLSGFVVVTLTYSKDSPLPSFSLQKPTPTPPTESTLIFSPNPLTVTVGATASAEIVIESQGAFPKILQLEISYEPAILSNMEILPGNISADQKVLLKKINYHTGRISYALETNIPQTTQKESRVIATLHFLPLNGFGTKETYINFLPKTTIKGANDKNAFKEGYGMRIILNQSVPRINIPLPTQSEKIAL